MQKPNTVLKSIVDKHKMKLLERQKVMPGEKTARLGKVPVKSVNRLS